MGNNPDPDKSHQHRLLWHSRRGMLELDLLLVPFVRDVWPSLPRDSQEQYEALLGEEDQDLFAWLVGREAPRAEFAEIVRKIIDHNSALKGSRG